MTSSRVHRWWTPYVFMLPALAVLAVFIGWSFVQAGYYSFTRFRPFSDPVFIGLDNYRTLLHDPRFWACLFNSAVYLLVTPALVFLSIWAAMVIHSGIRAGKWLRVLLFLPVVTPTIVGAVAWKLLLSSDGVLNAALAGLGLSPLAWLTQYPLTLISPMLVTVWKGFGFYMMIFLAALIGVPKELEEAAELDGASRWGVFRNVTLPHIWPMVALVLVISSISAMKVFDEIFVTVRGVPIEHQTVVPLVYNLSAEVCDYGLASAVGITLFVIVLAMSLINLKLSSRRAAA